MYHILNRETENNLIIWSKSAQKYNTIGAAPGRRPVLLADRSLPAAFVRSPAGRPACRSAGLPAAGLDPMEPWGPYGYGTFVNYSIIAC